LSILTVFIPDQVSWAFGYNPQFYGANVPALCAWTKPERIWPQPISNQVPQSISHVLKQIAGKNKMRLQINFG